MMKKFGKFLKRSKDIKFAKPSKKIESNNNTFTCLECGKQGHIKFVFLMVDLMDDSSTIEETEVNYEFEEVLEAFNEMHEEAQRLVVSNNKLRSDLKLHITKLTSTQSELDKLRQENEKLVSSYKAIGCVCAYTSLNMDDYKSLQIEFEQFKKDHYEERIKLKIELSYLKDLFKK